VIAGRGVLAVVSAPVATPLDKMTVKARILDMMRVIVAISQLL
jgi:hypothetical protein